MLDGFAEYGYWGLFAASFLAATILPLSSEVVLAALIAGGMDVTTSIVYATIGNSLGGATSYYLGRLGKIEWLEKWFKVKPEKIDSMIKRLKNKGAIMGFFGFLPIIGEIIIIALGFMRASPTVTLVSMSIGKLIRYIVIGFAAGYIAL